MGNYRKIMELVLEGRGYNEIVEAVGCSRRDVSVVKKTVAARGITAGLVESMTESDVQAMFPDGRKRVSDEYESPDFNAVLSSMKANRHFTLQQAWRKYVGADGQRKKYGYSQYCHLFGEHLRVNDLVATLRHEPGRAMLVDWAGDTINVVDAVTAELTRAYLFVAVLPFSGAVFCHASLNMKSEAWLDAHVRAFSFFGGVTQIIVRIIPLRLLIGARPAMRSGWSMPATSNSPTTTGPRSFPPGCASPATRPRWSRP